MSLRFQETCRQHARTFWPGQCDDLGEDGLNARVQLAIDRAAQFGIEAERDVARFLDLLFVWGDDFAESEPTAWARDILEDETLDSPLKVHQLSFRTKKELELAGEPR
jgi:hypothetical protein